MPYGFLDIAVTPSVRAAQAEMGSDHLWRDFKGHRAFDRFTEAEAAFIAARNSFYMASVSEAGWPYVQHRGGPPGFLQTIDDRTLAFADYRGNRQYLSLGNLAADGRCAMILMDYANRSRLKIFARADAIALHADEVLTERLRIDGYKAVPERIIKLSLEAFDWNCPQHITRRFSEFEIARMMAPLSERIQALEVENEALRARLLEER